MNIRYDNGLLFIDIKISYLGKSKLIKNVVIDTGASHTIISPDIVSSIGISASPLDKFITMYGIGGEHYAYRKKIDSISICGMDLKDIETQGHCALNPVAFEENKYQIKKVANPKKVVIIGGGIGGMETARLCAMMGHKVDLYEKTDRLGGVFIAAAAPEFKEKDKDLIKWYCTQIAKLPISVHLNTEVKDISKLDADEIVIATGSKVRKLPIIGFEKGVEAVDFLLGNKEVGETVAVIGGGLTGCEIAYDLARKGKKPFIVEMADELIKSAGICAANSSCLKDYLRFYKVPVYLESSLKEIKDNGVIIQTADGIKEINCESVILSVGYTPNPLCEKSEHIHVIGDAAKVGNLKTVIWGAYDLAFSL